MDLNHTHLLNPFGSVPEVAYAISIAYPPSGLCCSMEQGVRHIQLVARAKMKLSAHISEELSSQERNHSLDSQLNYIQQKLEESGYNLRNASFSSNEFCEKFEDWADQVERVISSRMRTLALSIP